MSGEAPEARPTTEALAHALGGRRSGSRWLAHCPAHEDKNPSLSITEKDGKPLVYCYAGCSQQAVIAALRGRGLWPERSRREFSTEERREWTRAAEAAKLAQLWRAAALKEADAEKLEALRLAAKLTSDYMPEAAEKILTECWEPACRRLFLLQTLHGAGLAKAFLAATERQPGETHRLVQAGIATEQDWAALTGQVIKCLRKPIEEGA